MKMKKTLLAALLAAAPVASMAASGGPTGHLDVYYTDADIELDGPVVNGDESGDGFGIRGSGKVADKVFVFGQYEKNKYDNDAELQTIRAGLGFGLWQDANTSLDIRAEFIDVDGKDFPLGIEIDDSGYGVHVGAAFRPLPGLSLFGDVGWIDVGDYDGPEYTVGAVFNVSNQFGLFADYRITDVEDGDIGLKSQDLHLGVRFNF
ncbi:outer membrane beta-barrel protein [Solimonas sp. SE-A11]|uniref:outer membrane beta-barrel protein n=1 Tax=Solimonas sp. SE-A11 TaxID=3054954 RepID=UPI00259C6AAB|nr:outer membrane beta-barrel protein [Solimonas sp. SE-A11]MDM4770440.1 outer membrane beta-barrel protein [Solimonas sp. SE-A11]